MSTRLAFIRDINHFDEVTEDILRMNVYLNEESDIKEVCQRINQNYLDVNCFVMQEANDDNKWLVIHPKDLNKGTALSSLGEKLNISLNEIVYFGDSTNDLEVMNTDVYSVAMGNALDSIKEVADEVTLSNQEDGIAVFLEQQLFN